MSSRQLPRFRPSVEALEERAVPTTTSVPPYTGLVDYTPFTVVGTSVNYTPFTAPGTPIKFETTLQQSIASTSTAASSSSSFHILPSNLLPDAATGSVSSVPATLLSTMQSSGFIPSDLLLSTTSSSSSSTTSSQHLNYQLQLPSGTVTFNPLSSGSTLNPGFANYAQY